MNHNCKTTPKSAAWSVDRQVRFLSGSLILMGIILTFVNPVFVIVPLIVALGMIISAVAGTCAMGVIVSWLPWNRL